MDKKQPIIEIYSCLQGEGKLVGVPHILIRTTGCPLRCQFSDTDFCDSSYTSWAPEKGFLSLRNVRDVLLNYPQIKHTMITGGSPTMHPELLVELVNLCKSFEHYVTIETEGTAFVATNADLISLSPKFSNSKPRPGTMGPRGLVSEILLQKHEKRRTNWLPMKQMVGYYRDFQIKPVISSLDESKELSELKDLLNYLECSKEKVFLMPSGGTQDELSKRRVDLIEYCVSTGYNYTDRLQIIAYNNKKGV